MRIHRWLPIVLALAACDKEPEVDVAGLERKVEVLEQQQGEATQARTEIEKRLQDSLDGRAVASADLKAANEQIDALNREVDTLRQRVDELATEPEAVPLPPPEPPKPIKGRPVAGERYRVKLGDAQTKGNTTAKVTIVIWSDFQCPFCSRVQKTLGEIEREYKGKVRFAAKHNPLPFHNNAMPAAVAAEAAGKQGKFWEMHDLLYENGRDLTHANFLKWARKLKLNVGRFKKDLANPTLEKKIKDQQAEGNVLGARGTPAFFINGRYLAGAQPFEAFKKLIDEELAEADRLLAAGTNAKDVYDALVDKGKAKPD